MAASGVVVLITGVIDKKAIPWEEKESMTHFFYDDDADLGRLEGREIAIIGYGNQGRTQALNLRDSGVENIVVGSVRDESWDQAEEDGFEVMSISEAAQRADILFVLLPDEVAPAVYEDEIKPALSSGKTLNFSSGYNITFGHIVPPESTDIVMVAPRMVGDAFRRLYEAGKGAPCFVDVSQDASGEAWDDCLALAKAPRMHQGRGSGRNLRARDAYGPDGRAGRVAAHLGCALQRFRGRSRSRSAAGGRGTGTLRFW